jgi:hypothetical protein
VTSTDEIALDLLRRLLGGERGQLPLHLAMLLEKSSPSDHGDEHYRQILPPELAELRISPEISEEILTALCAEVLRNPDQALIFAISFTGTDQSIKTAARILTNPPRALTIVEACAVLALLNCYLPYRLSNEPDVLPKGDLERVVRVAEEFQDIEETGAGEERSARIGIRMHAAGLLKSLRAYGIIGA